MISKSKKTKMSIIRKISVIPVLFITLFAFSVSSEKYVASNNVMTEGISQDNDPWAPQNAMEESIFIIGYGSKVTVPVAKAPETIYPSARKSPPKGAFRYNDVEVKPKFMNENDAARFLKYISENINYPTIAAENGRIGKVVVSFIINERGKVEDIEAEVKADESLAKEVIRVVKTFPDWIPGKQNGKNVPVQCYLFAEFKLQQ
jgi:TonB family protein